MPSRVAVIATTLATEADARSLGASLVEARAAACAQIDGPITSTYWWEGKTQTATEWRLTLKTSPTKVSKLLELLEARHSYSVPEILVETIDASDSYAEWVDRETTDIANQ